MELSARVKVKEEKSSCGMVCWVVYYGTTKIITFNTKPEAESYKATIQKSLGGK